MTPSISIIIPTLNEEKNLPRTLEPLIEKESCEIIIIDGGSTDETLSLAKDAGCTTISSPCGRGVQMNNGVAVSTGDLLLFLHADTLLPNDFPELIRQALARPKVVAGAFSLKIDDDAKSIALIAHFANLRSRFLQLPYGDQALFTTRSMFTVTGGFPEQEIMEDFVFVGKLRKEGKIITLRKQVTTSARRWQKMGLLKTTLINQLIVCGHLLGVSSTTLAGWYQRLRGV